ncbi:MAG: PAS domain S-box protein [Spirochaetota bacterium]|nr:MAG: PAS domain S-box protein [Spirochaetota bacterium]
MIAEDESNVAIEIKNRTLNMGYSVSAVVTSGKEAIKRAKESIPDLILMDVKLKGKMDGVEAAEHIHKQFNIPVVYLADYEDNETLKKAKITEPFGYILKPFEERELHAAIELALYRYNMVMRLKESEHWLSTIFKSIADAVIVINKKGNITFMNPASESLTGWNKQEALGRNLPEVFNIIYEHTCESDESSLLKPIEEGAHINLVDRMMLLDKKGKEIPIDFRASPIQDKNENISGSVLVFRDITGRKLAEQELKSSLTKLRKATGGIINAMALMVERRDPYTAGHQRRVANLARAIATEMGFTDEQVDGIRMAGVIHDLGKISVPAEILSKPGHLNETEFNLITVHPEAGYEILKTIDFPWPVARILRQHHERIDGSGYPFGIMDKEILIESKTIGVADVVEAMASHRPYRPSLGIDKALKEISQNRGITYDPKIVDACLKLFSEKRFDFEGVNKSLYNQ